MRRFILLATTLLLLVFRHTAYGEDATNAVERAVEHYKAKRFEPAGDAFLEAFALSKLPNQLRNAAKAYQEGGHLDKAKQSWERYLDHQELSATERAEASAQLQLIEERRKADRATMAAEEAKKEAERIRLEAEKAEKERAAKEAEAEQRRAEEARKRAAEAAQQERERLAREQALHDQSAVGPIVTIGAGAVALIIGGALFLHAESRLSTLDDDLSQTDSSGKIVGINRTDAQSDLDGINDERSISAIVSGIGLGAAVFGTIWLLSQDDPPTAGPVLVAGEQGFSVAWSGSW